MADKRDGDTKQLVADAEALIGDKAEKQSAPQSTREIVSSAERVLRGEAEPPKLSPVPLLIVSLVVIVLALLGVYSAFVSGT
ncbi:MAG: hypothetical protein AAF654_08915 [Myxococcota bacterium]